MRRSHARPRIKSCSNNNNKDNSMDHPIKFQIRPASTTTTRSSKHERPNLSLTSATAAIAFIIIIIFFFFLYLFLSGSNFKNSSRYGIVIDGGSSGSRIHVFRFRFRLGSGLKLVFEISDHASLKVNPGLSAFMEDPKGAGGSLAELVEFAQGKVPVEMWNETEIRLMATAGMRLLGSEIRERILESCRDVLRDSGFIFRDEWAEVISGSDEGAYAWVVTNYALGTLGGDPLETAGIIELGGASAQVTFVSSEPMPPEFSRTITFGNVTYNLYSHSLLHFGQDVAAESLRESLMLGDLDSDAKSIQKEIYIDPCTPKGYSLKQPSGSLTEEKGFMSSLQGGGNFSQCRSAALSLLQKGKEKCSYQHCYVGSTFMPKLRGRFLATENFFHTSKFFGLGQKAFLSDLITAGEQFCGEDWSKLKGKHSSFKEEDLLRYCFSSAYIVALLHDSLGIALDDQRIGFANQVGDIPLDWAMGAFILHTTSHIHTHHPLWFYAITGYDSAKLLYLTSIPIILIFIVWSVSKWRKPQLKTVYDLDKGRYLVTRVR